MNKWSLNGKIALVLSIFVVACIGIAYMGLSKMKEINSAMNNIVSGHAARVHAAHGLKELFFVQLINEKNFILEDDKEGMDIMGKRLDDRHAEMSQKFVDYMTVADDEGKKEAAQFKDGYHSWWEVTNTTRKLAMGGDDKAAFQISKTKGRDLRLKGEEIIDGMVDRNTKMMKDDTERASEEYASARNVVLVIGITATLAGILLAFFIMKAMSQAIDRVITNLDDNSQQVTGAAQQIAASSEQLSQAATEQASSLEQTASSIEEMNSMVQKNSENAKKSAEISATSQASATKGKQVVLEMITAIDGINTCNKEIADIVKVIADIGNKTKVINDIVFQTKLLSFNASVEAARAGEHGKGFAVVAEEVGKLAEMSGNAAKEISAMLEGSIQKVERIVNDTNGKVQTGTEIARQCGEVLDEIVVSVSSVSQMVGEISIACQEQAQGVQEITKAMNQLDQVTQENAATSEECASTAEELSAQASSLRGVVQVLIETVKGAKGVAPTGAYTAQPATPDRSKVVPIRSAANKKPRSTDSGHTLKMAAGAEGSVPSEDDPRFREI